MASGLNWWLISEADEKMVGGFRCDKPGAAELVDFLRGAALREHQENLSTTYLFGSRKTSVLDAYVTVSAAGVRAPPEWLKTTGTDRTFIPSVMIDYIAVANHMDGEGLGFQIFEWLQPRVMRLNESLGVRAIVLGVRALNWPAYGIYKKRWDFTPLPINKKPAPDPSAARPSWLNDDAMIHMYYDLVEHNGPFVREGDGQVQALRAAVLAYIVRALRRES